MKGLRHNVRKPVGFGPGMKISGTEPRRSRGSGKDPLSEGTTELKLPVSGPTGNVLSDWQGGTMRSAHVSSVKRMNADNECAVERAMSNDHKRKINAKAAVKDIRSGMADSDLRKKYGLSANALDALFSKLIGAGLLNQYDLDQRTTPKDRFVHVAWKCPACGSSQMKPYPECPECGVIVAKYAARHSSAAEHGAGLVDEGIRPGPFSRDGRRDQVSGEGLPISGSLSQAPLPVAVGTAEGSPAVAPPEMFEQQEDSDGVESDELDDMTPEPRSMDKTEWLLLLLCPLGALLCFPVFWFRWTLETLKTLVHEMGHAICGWVFAYPSFPAFDFLWGGGMTLHTQRSTALLILIYAGFAWLFWMYRKNTATVVFLFVVICMHALFSYTSIHSVMIAFMGHGTELIIGGWFIYRALSGRAVVHSVERPLYGVIGYFIVFWNINFAYRLLTSPLFRAEYESAKGGIVDMDFVRIAGDYLHTSFNSVVYFFLICSVLTLVLSFLAFRYMEYIHAAVAALWKRGPSARVRGTQP
jgi:hypothetical protein